MNDYLHSDGRELEIRLAEESDMGEAAETFRQVASERVYLDTEEVPHETAGIWGERWKENGKDSLFAIGAVGGRIIGGLVLTPYSRSPKSSHVRTLGMWILKEFRGLNAGNSLIDYAMEWGRARSISKIHLGVFSSNTGAIGLYIKKGFQVEGSLKNNALINGTLVDEIFMGLEL